MDYSSYSIFTYLATEPTALIIVVGIIGLIVGSFLNVVIYRLPIMIQRDWRCQCTELLGISDPAVATPQEPFNLSHPRSRCPHCQHLITALENIPILSYLWQKGRCTHCQQSISIRYPLIEALTMVLSVIVAWRFGFGLPLLGMLVLTWALIATSIIDFEHYYLFDDITMPLLWLGLFCNLHGLYTDIHSSLIGAIAGYLSLWSVNFLFKLIRHKDGMGAGDFKLLALLGAWAGWQALPMIILMSALVGSIVGISLIVLRKQDMGLKIPFGPYLASAGWICLITGLTYQNYLKWTTTYPS